MKKLYVTLALLLLGSSIQASSVQPSPSINKARYGIKKSIIGGTINVEEYGLVPYYFKAEEQMKEMGKTPSAAFTEVLEGLKNNRVTFPVQVVLASQGDLKILRTLETPNQLNEFMKGRKNEAK